jgi:hypothetical protein
MRGWSSGGAEAVVGVGEGRVVLWLEAEAREVAAAQRRSGGGRNFGRRRRHPFKGGGRDTRGGGSGVWAGSGVWGTAAGREREK